MTKKYKYFLLGLAAAAAVTGCGKEKDVPTGELSTDAIADTEIMEEDLGNEDIEDPDSADMEYTDVEDMENLDSGLEDTESETTEETEAPLAPITPSDYLVQDAAEYVELASSYDGMEIIRYTYDITDEMVQEQIRTALEDAAVESEAETSSTGDLVYVSLKSSVKGGEAETEDTYFTLGDEEYGAEFDAQLTGVSVGDVKKFSIDFDSDAWIEEWADQTVAFEAEIMGITHYTLPEYDDKFLEEYTEYTTKEDYEASIRESLEQEYTEISYSDAIEELFKTAVDQTGFTGAPVELYDQCREEVLSSYTAFLGDASISTEDVLDLFGITDEDIEAETRDTVNRRLLISAYCSAHKLTVTEEEYQEYVTENASYYGAGSAVEFEEQYSREALVLSLYEAKVADCFYQSAKITEVPFSDEEALTDEDFAAIEDAEVITTGTE